MPQQTKRKRRTKHRGNAAGMVEARGRTGRKLSDGERGSVRSTAKLTPQQRRELRLSTPPSWRGAITKAGIAALLFAVAVTLLFGQPILGALGLAIFTFLLYVPLSYYTDRLVYRRHLKRRAAASGQG
jgi:hypothetical protein